MSFCENRCRSLLSSSSSVHLSCGAICADSGFRCISGTGPVPTHGPGAIARRRQLPGLLQPGRSRVPIGFCMARVSAQGSACTWGFCTGVRASARAGRARSRADTCRRPDTHAERSMQHAGLDGRCSSFRIRGARARALTIRVPHRALRAGTCERRVREAERSVDVERGADAERCEHAARRNDAARSVHAERTALRCVMQNVVTFMQHAFQHLKGRADSSPFKLLS